MTVKELIDMLHDANPYADVVAYNADDEVDAPVTGMVYSPELVILQTDDIS